MKNKRKLEYIIQDEYSGKRVDEVLRAYWGISGSLIKDLKHYEDGILLNGEHIRTVDTVSEGDKLSVAIYDTASEGIIPQKMELDILYEDEDILIINKPSGLPTHPSRGHFTDTLANGVISHYIENGEEHVFRAVNRLDMDTSGVMCIAKNSYSHARLVEQMKTGELSRKYAAIVEGAPEGGIIDAPIMRESFLKRIVHPDGQRAVTHYRVISRYEGYSLIELSLETGRTHQIRVHMSYIGHPLLGDWLYGTEDHSLFDRQALHSKEIHLRQPVTGEELCFMSKIAPDMQSFLDGLKKI